MNTPISRTLVVCLLAALAAAGCARREAEDDTAATQAAPEAAPEAPPPPKEVAALKIDVTLSPQAEQKLKAAGETVRVEVVYGGDPAPNATLQPNELGMIELGKKTLNCPVRARSNSPNRKWTAAAWTRSSASRR